MGNPLAGLETAVVGVIVPMLLFFIGFVIMVFTLPLGVRVCNVFAGIRGTESEIPKPAFSKSLLITFSVIASIGICTTIAGFVLGMVLPVRADGTNSLWEITTGMIVMYGLSFFLMVISLSLLLPTTKLRAVGVSILWLIPMAIYGFLLAAGISMFLVWALTEK